MTIRYLIYQPDDGLVVGEGMVPDGSDIFVPAGVAALESAEGKIETHYVDVATMSVLAYSDEAVQRLRAGAPAGFTWAPAEGVWRDDRDLAQAKAAAWDGVKHRRAAVEYGAFQWDGSEFDADPESRNRIMGAVQLATMALAASAPYEIVWTLHDDSTRTLSALEMCAVGMALGARVSAAHARAAALRAQIAAAADRETLDAIDLDAGWPT